MSRRQTSPYRVQVLDRALAILDLLAQEPSGFALPALSEKAGLHRSTVHRLLQVLEQHRLVEKDAGRGKYRLGLKLFELGSKAVAFLDLAERARPWLKRLVELTGETAHLCILDQGEVLSIANVESPHTIRTPSTIGRRVPMHCTAVGKAMLAYLAEPELDEMIRNRVFEAQTRRTITSHALLRKELEKVRVRGWAVDDQEFEENLRCVGAPVWDYTGNVVAALSIAGPAFRVTPRKVTELARTVVEIAASLSIDLGAQTSVKRIR